MLMDIYFSFVGYSLGLGLIFMTWFHIKYKLVTLWPHIILIYFTHPGRATWLSQIKSEIKINFKDTEESILIIVFQTLI